MCECPQRPEEGTEPLELDLKVVVSNLMWMLGTELWSFEEQ